MPKKGEVGAGGGTWGPRRRARAQLTLKLERTCSACGTATAASAAGDHPRRPSPYTPKSQDAGRVGRAEGQLEKGDGPGALAERAQTPQTSPRLLIAVRQSAGVRSGQARKAAPGFGRVPRTPAALAGGRGVPARDGDAVTFRDPRLGSGRARARRGPGTRGPARALQAGPLLRGARSTWSARRAPEAGGDRLQPVQDRSETATPGRETGSGANSPVAGGWGAGGRVRPGCPRRGSRWGAGAGRCGPAPVTRS